MVSFRPILVVKGTRAGGYVLPMLACRRPAATPEDETFVEGAVVTLTAAKSAALVAIRLP